MGIKVCQIFSIAVFGRIAVFTVEGYKVLNAYGFVFPSVMGGIFGHKGIAVGKLGP